MVFSHHSFHYVHLLFFYSRDSSRKWGFFCFVFANVLESFFWHSGHESSCSYFQRRWVSKCGKKNNTLIWRTVVQEDTPRHSFPTLFTHTAKDGGKVTNKLRCSDFSRPPLSFRCRHVAQLAVSPLCREKGQLNCLSCWNSWRYCDTPAALECNHIRSTCALIICTTCEITNVFRR